jgi:hypothetical protein
MVLKHQDDGQSVTQILINASYGDVTHVRVRHAAVQRKLIVRAHLTALVARTR